MASASLTEKRSSTTLVPEYFYAKDEDVCGFTKAGFLWASNLLCAIFHLGLAVATVYAATRSGKGMDTPRLTVYVTNLTWRANSTDALVPTYVVSGDGLMLAHMTMWFFLLSFLAHAIIVLGNYKQAFAVSRPKAREVTRFSGWYYVWIHQCRQPMRWAECELPPRLPHPSFPSPSPIAGLRRMQTRP